MSDTQDVNIEVITLSGGIDYAHYDERARRLRSAAVASIFKAFRSAESTQTRVPPCGATTHPCG